MATNVTQQLKQHRANIGRLEHAITMQKAQLSRADYEHGKFSAASRQLASSIRQNESRLKQLQREANVLQGKAR